MAKKEREKKRLTWICFGFFPPLVVSSVFSLIWSIHLNGTKLPFISPCALFKKMWVKTFLQDSFSGPQHVSPNSLFATFFVPMNHFRSNGRRRSNWRANLAKSRQAEHLGMDDEGHFSSAYVVFSQFFTARSLNPPGPNSKAQIFHCRLQRQTTDDLGGECSRLFALHFSGLCKNWTNDILPSWPSGWKQFALNILTCSLKIHMGMLRVPLTNSSFHPWQIQTSQWPWRTRFWEQDPDLAVTSTRHEQILSASRLMRYTQIIFGLFHHLLLLDLNPPASRSLPERQKVFSYSSLSWAPAAHNSFLWGKIT